MGSSQMVPSRTRLSIVQREREREERRETERGREEKSKKCQMLNDGEFQLDASTDGRQLSSSVVMLVSSRDNLEKERVKKR